MPGTSTPLLQLYKPDPNDFVSVLTDLNANMDKVDAYALGAQANVRTMGGKRYSPGTGLPVTTAGGAVEILGGVDTGSIAYVAGRVYKVEFRFNYTNSIVNDRAIFRIRDTNLVGAIQMQPVTFRLNSGDPYHWTMAFLYKPGVTAAKTYVLTMARYDGTGTITIGAGIDTFTEVTDLGPASIITDV